MSLLVIMFFVMWYLVGSDINSICTEIVNVRIEYDGKITDYTAEEFLERLG